MHWEVGTNILFSISYKFLFYYLYISWSDRKGFLRFEILV